ncbi:MAG: hypothetical protein KatS3mg087_0494 [Patescibacteria group bacterium]|nr:MAG: hypothetical protein KatS3mg087_0494 [Patescibacteria group bacterium]
MVTMNPKLSRIWDKIADDANIVWVLGAHDNEMVAIENLLTRFNQKYVYASSPNGQRVTPKDAYTGNWTAPVPDDADVITVELTPNGQITPIYAVDHHGNGVWVPSVSQVASILAGGLKTLIAGMADHDMVASYRALPDLTMLYRREVLQLDDNAWQQAEEFVQQAQNINGVLFHPQPSPNRAVGDILIARNTGGFFQVPSDQQGKVKFAILGQVDRDRVNQLFSRLKDAGIDHYWFPDRGVGGFYASSVDDAVTILRKHLF